MIHHFTMIVELSFDDEDGEYDPPSIREIDHRLSSALYSTAVHLGFDKKYSVETAKGTAKQAFGI